MIVNGAITQAEIYYVREQALIELIVITQRGTFPVRLEPTRLFELMKAVQADAWSKITCAVRLELSSDGQKIAALGHHFLESWIRLSEKTKPQADKIVDEIIAETNKKEAPKPTTRRGRPRKQK